MARQALPLLGDPHPKVRLRAVRALSGLRDPGGMNLVMSRGLRDSRAHAHQSASVVLGAIGNPRFFGTLLARFAEITGGTCRLSDKK